MRRAALVSIGIGLIVVGLLPYSYAEFKLHEHNWTPLRYPFVFKVGQIETPEFVTDNEGTYIVSLVFDPINVEREECLVGNTGFKNSCNYPLDGLVARWSLLRGDQLLINHQPYHPGAFGGPGGVQTELGRFEGHRGGRQRVRVDILQDSPELAAASPRVMVEAHWRQWEDWAELAQMGFFLAALLGLLGTACIIFAIRNSKSAV